MMKTGSCQARLTLFLRIKKLQDDAASETAELIHDVECDAKEFDKVSGDMEAMSRRMGEIGKLSNMRDYFLKSISDPAPDEKVFLARHIDRPHI